MKYWVISENGQDILVKSNRKVNGADDYLDERCNDLSCYVKYKEEDGTITWLLSEQKYADWVDKQRGQEYRISKQK